MQMTRGQASAAVDGTGWRYVLGAYQCSVAVVSLVEASELAGEIVRACGPDADGQVRVDLRADRVELRLQDSTSAHVSARSAELALDIDRLVRGRGLGYVSPTGESRSLQAIEIAIDALDIPAIRPFWKAVLAYAPEPGLDGPTDAIVDPVGQGPSIWFQQMDAPRPQRNRIHLDLSVAHDQAEARIAAALAAGGRLVSDAEARAFWILADAEGNEICVCTWQDRD